MFELSQVGLAFNALVSGTVGVISFFFMIYLFRRWKNLNDLIRAYAWFWFFTMLLWTSLSIYYIFVVVVGYNPVVLKGIGIIVQGAIFFTGAPLFYYLGLKVLQNILLA